MSAYSVLHTCIGMGILWYLWILGVTIRLKIDSRFSQEKRSPHSYTCSSSYNCPLLPSSNPDHHICLLRLAHDAVCVCVYRAVGTFARALDCSSSVRQPSLHMSAAAASRDITLVRLSHTHTHIHTQTHTYTHRHTHRDCDHVASPQVKQTVG